MIFLDYFTLAERYEGMISDLMKLSEPQDWRGFNSSEKVSLHFFGGKVKVVLDEYGMDFMRRKYKTQ